MWVFLVCFLYWKGAGGAQTLGVVAVLPQWCCVVAENSFRVFREGCSCPFVRGVWLLDEERFVPGGLVLDRGSVSPAWAVLSVSLDL